MFFFKLTVLYFTVDIYYVAHNGNENVGEEMWMIGETENKFRLWVKYFFNK